MKIRIDDLQPRELASGFTAKFIHTENITIAKVSIKAGCDLPEHYHHNEQVSLIDQGEIIIRMDGREYHLKSGDALLIPSNVPHSAKTITDCEVTDVFHPVRDDYR